MSSVEFDADNIQGNSSLNLQSHNYHYAGSNPVITPKLKEQFIIIAVMILVAAAVLIYGYSSGPAPVSTKVVPDIYQPTNPNVLFNR